MDNIEELIEKIIHSPNKTNALITLSNALETDKIDKNIIFKFLPELINGYKTCDDKNSALFLYLLGFFKSEKIRELCCEELNSNSTERSCARIRALIYLLKYYESGLRRRKLVQSYLESNDGKDGWGIYTIGDTLAELGDSYGIELLCRLYFGDMVIVGFEKLYYAELGEAIEHALARYGKEENIKWLEDFWENIKRRPKEYYKRYINIKLECGLNLREIKKNLSLTSGKGGGIHGYLTHMEREINGLVSIIKNFALPEGLKKSK